MGVSGPVDQIEYTGVYGPGSIHWKLGKLTGTVEETNNEPGGNPRLQRDLLTDILRRRARSA